MKFSLKIARRYLFSSKSTNAVNIISLISMIGITVGTAALIIVLSVFNGFEDLITDLFNSFNPDVKVTPIEGKTFQPDSGQLVALKDLDAVQALSQTIEEIAFFEYNGSQDFGIIKGVDEQFVNVSGVDSSIVDGVFVLANGDRDYAVIGSGMVYNLGIDIEDEFKTLNVYMPKRKRTANLSRAFKKQYIYPAGMFSIQQEFDAQYVIATLDFARSLMGFRTEISALEIGLKPDADVPQTLQDIQAIMGDNFEVKDRYMQDEAFFKLMNMEKWIAFAVLTFVIILVAFNMVGSIGMLILDKQKDISILKAMGATDDMVRNVFLFEGTLRTLVGVLLGFVLALILYTLQVTIGLVHLQGSANLLVQTYPISLRFTDFVAIFFVVWTIGALASWIPSERTRRITALVRNG